MLMLMMSVRKVRVRVTHSDVPMPVRMAYSGRQRLIV